MNSKGISASTPGKRTVEAERRRKVTPPPAGGRPRAATPQRDTSASGGASSGGIGGSVGGGGLRLPGGKGPASIGGAILLLLIVCVFFVFNQFFGSDSTDQPAVEAPVSEALVDTPVGQDEEPSGEGGAAFTGQLGGGPTPAPFQSSEPAPAAETEPTPEPVELTPAASGESPRREWLVLLYQDADDKILEQDIYLDLNEAERAGSNDRVTIVAQVDRYNGAYTGDGDWTSAKRYLIEQDDSLARVGSQEIADLGEVNMADGASLVDFVTWAVKTYPADKVALILSDHGMGWPGGWSDPTARSRTRSEIPLVERLDDHLYLNEIDEALSAIRKESGLEKIELIGMDACLMGQAEVLSALAPHARYAVASQEVEPALGWAYTGFLDELNKHPEMDGARLSKLIVDSYIEQDQRILDSRARAEFLSQGSPMGGLFGQASDIPPEQLARQIGQASTLTAFDLSQVPALEEKLSALAYALKQISQKPAARARTYAQSFTSIFGKDVPPSYIDLGHFVQLVQEGTRDKEVNQAGDDLLEAIQQTVIAEKHGPKKPGATGLTIYFPNSQLYASPTAGRESYVGVAERFAEETLWDDFLAFHYTGEAFDQTAAAPAASSAAAMRAPGEGQISIAPVKASNTSVRPGETVTLSTDISGENIGYIYLFAGFYDKTANSVFIADNDYLESPESRELNGIYFPEWGEGDFTLEFKWEPVVFAINDGTTSAPALFRPASYGRSFEEAVYTVDGTYTYAESGDQVPARLYFVNGVLNNVVGFSGNASAFSGGDEQAGAPREIVPTAGDTFTIQETWLDLEQDGQVKETVAQNGTTLTFGDRMFTWETLDAAAGDYVVGFIVEDMDGNQTQSFTPITVR